MTNPEEETGKTVAKRKVKKVQGQPTNQDLNFLEEELLQVASLVYSELGGGTHGHVELLLKNGEGQNISNQ